jgi:hypothetical protein
MKSARSGTGPKKGTKYAPPSRVPLSKRVNDPALGLPPRAAVLPAEQRDPLAMARRKAVQQTGSGGVTGVLGEWVGPNLAQLLTTGHTGSKAGAGLDALTMLPFLRGPRAVFRGAQALREGETAVEAARAARASMREAGPISKAYQARKLRYKDLTVHPTKARSVTGALSSVERAIDRASVRLGAGERAPNIPGVRLATAGERVTKIAGRATRVAGERAAASVAKHLRLIAKVKEGSPEDVAHYWWAQVPKAERNVETLGLVRDKQAQELQRVVSGDYERELAQNEAALKIEIANLRETDPGVFPSQQIQALRKIQTLRADIPQLKLDTAASIHVLDQTIAANPKLREELIDAVHGLNEPRVEALIREKRLDPESAAARQGRVAEWLGFEPTGEEAYLGHRLPLPERVGKFSGPGGTGRVASPRGVGSENKLILASQGRLRPTLRVAAEDWQGSRVFESALRARDDLGAIGDPFLGHVPPGHLVINRKGAVIPPNMKTAELAQFADGYEDTKDLREKAEEILRGFVAKDEKEALAMERTHLENGGSLEDLRVVPERLVNRYYSQFRGTKGTIAYDKMVDAAALSIVAGRLGYIPKNVVQNLVMAIPHQGAFLASNAVRAAQAMHDPELADLLRAEVGQHATGAIGKESTSKKLKRVSGAITRVTEEVLPFRLAAFMHEAAAEGVISKTRPWMNEQDRAALHDLLTNPKHEQLLNDIRQRANEAMGDFSRLTPDQMRIARRFLIIPGWLMAGSRYPFHFAANHPVRSALLAYLAAGEPGAPDHLNRPIDEYFTGTDYRQGIETPWGRIRTASLSPVSTPWEMGQALVNTIRGAGGPFSNVTTAFDFAQPLVAAAIEQLQGQGGSPTKRLEQLGRSLVPSGGFLYDIARPNAKATFPEDRTRLGRLKREVGVVPITVHDPEKTATGGRGSGRGSGGRGGSGRGGGRSGGGR